MSSGELPDSFDVPDDLSGLTKDGSDPSGLTKDGSDPSGLTEDGSDPSVALIITQVAGPAALAAACALVKVRIDAFGTPIGAVAVCRDLTGDAPVRTAQAISQIVKDVPVILIEERDGQLHAARWQDGAHDEDLPAGLVLDGAPAEIEDLVTGARTIDQIEGVVTSVGMSRFKALRKLRAAGRRSKES